MPRAPRTLIETTRIFRAVRLARDWFGDDFVDHFAATREWEWRQWLDARHRLGTEALLRDHMSTEGRPEHVHASDAKPRLEERDREHGRTPTRDPRPLGACDEAVACSSAGAA